MSEFNTKNFSYSTNSSMSERGPAVSNGSNSTDISIFILY